MTSFMNAPLNKLGQTLKRDLIDTTRVIEMFTGNAYENRIDEDGVGPLEVCVKSAK